MFCILRVGRKHKTMNSIKGFAKHMERLIEVPNADPKVDNEILIGTKEIYEDCSAYLQGVNIHANNVIARELLLTASPQFFKGLTSLQFEDWKAINRRWLQSVFGENVRYSVLHLDEST